MQLWPRPEKALCVAGLTLHHARAVPRMRIDI